MDHDSHFIDELIRRLPPKTVFPPEMPRYPNVWFLVDSRLALRRRYPYAIELVVGTLERELDLRDTFFRGVENPDLRQLLSRPGEGADFQARIGPVHVHQTAGNPTLSHSHQLHARFYPFALLSANAYELMLPAADGRRTFLAVPASLHYEVTTEEPQHPYVDDCPLCGITGEYDVPIDRAADDYCIKIHDPLGVEYLLHGTVRGARISDDVDRVFTGVSGIHVDGMTWTVHDVVSQTRDPGRFGFVTITPSFDPRS